MSAGYLPRLRAMLSLTLRPSSWTNGWWVKRFTQSGALFDQKWLYLTGDIGVVPAGSQYVTGYEWLFETATSRWIDQYRSYWGSPIGVWKLYFDPSICNNAASFWCFPNLYGVDRTAAYNTTREAWQNFDHAPGDTLAVPCQGSPYVPTAVTAQSCFIKVISESAMEGRITNERFETYTTQTVNSLTNHTLNYDSVGAQQSFNSTAESRGADWVNRRLDPTSPWQPLFLTTTSGPGIHAGNKSREMGDPVNSALGAFVTEETDLAMPALGVPFQLRRVYSSASPAEGALGQGWSHSYSARLAVAGNGDVTLYAEDGQQVQFSLQPDGSFSVEAGGLSKLNAVAAGYELVRTDQRRYRFDATGRLGSIVDRNGNGLGFAYDGAGLLATITDGASRVWTLSHTSGLLTSVAAPDGRTVTYGYTSGSLTSVADVTGSTTTYSYDGAGRMSKIIDRNGNEKVTNVYGADGRVVQQTDALGNVTTHSWNDASQTLSVTDARGNVWQDVYSENFLVRRIDPLGNTTRFFYDRSHNLAQVVDPRGNATTMTYDARGNMLARVAPAVLGYQETFTYDSMNNLLTVQDGLGNTTNFEYDARGNPVEVTGPDPDGPGPAGPAVNSFTLGATTGLPTTITDPRGKATQLAYDGTGNTTAITSPLGNETTMRYDAAGRVVGTVEARGNAPGATPGDYESTYTYDAAGRILTSTDPLGNTTTFVYDDVGNLTRRTDAKNRSTSYAYDAANRLVTVTAPDLSVTTYAYDAIGNLTSRTNAKNQTTQYTYDLANRLQTVLAPSNGLWTYEYDANGNLTKVTDANGNATATTGDGVTTYTYDVVNRLTAIDYSDATPDVQYAYDATGNRTSMVDVAGTQTYAYDALGRLTGMTRGLDSFAYAYDAGDNVTSRTYPGVSAATYAYDDDGRLASVTRSGATTSYAYDAAGQLTQTQLPAANGYVEARAYDRVGRVLSIAHARAGVALASASYAYDAVGNPTSMTTLAGVNTYAYDVLDRLVGVCFQSSCPGAGDPFIRYAYDPVGNRTAEMRPNGTTSSSYDAGDRLVSTSGPGGTTSYAFDANGNQTAAGTRTFGYDQAGRMSSTAAAGVTTSYGYDGDGVRLSATIEGWVATSFLWDVNFGLPQLALERVGGLTLRSYLHGAGPVSIKSFGLTGYLHRDAIGSVTNVTAASGAALGRYAYEPFGAIRSQNDPAGANPLRFAGEYLDRTGLYHLRARQYDTTTGRFTATDPLAPSMSRPYLSSYVYADNLPTALVDPSGWGAVWADQTGGEGCGGWLNEVRCFKNWFIEDQIGWRSNCARSTSCLLGAEFNVFATVFPGGRAAKAGAGAIERAGLALRTDIQLSGGRGGGAVKTLTGPPNSVVRGAPGRIYQTDSEGRVIADITAGRVKPVTPGGGFGPKRPPTPLELEWLRRAGG